MYFSFCNGFKAGVFVSATRKYATDYAKKGKKNLIAVFHLRYSYFRWVEKSPQVAKQKIRRRCERMSCTNWYVKSFYHLCPSITTINLRSSFHIHLQLQSILIPILYCHNVEYIPKASSLAKMLKTCCQVFLMLVSVF